MKKHITLILLIFSTIWLQPEARAESDISLTQNDYIFDFEEVFIKDPNAKYRKEKNWEDIVIGIPGQKLDIQSAIKIEIGQEEFKFAQRIDRSIIEKAKIFIKKYSSEEVELYAAKNLKGYILLYFFEGNVRDGGFEIIYSKELKRIIGRFEAGYKG